MHKKTAKFFAAYLSEVESEYPFIKKWIIEVGIGENA